MYKTELVGVVRAKISFFLIRSIKTKYNMFLNLKNQ